MKNHKKNCFTLIELLVVIAIIAILAGMLLPALNSSRDKGRTTDCLSKTKQFNSVVLTYTDDYYPWVPGGYTIGKYRTDAGTLSYESYFIQKLVSIYPDSLPKVNINNKFWLCPSLSSYAVEQLTLATKKLTGSLVHTYGINTSVRASDYRGRINKITSPARCASVGDSSMKPQGAKGSYGNASINPEIETESWMHPFRHNGQTAANYSFWDGHAETRHYTRVPTIMLNSGAKEKMKATVFWQIYSIGNNEYADM